MRRRFMGDVYYYTALPGGGEGRGVGTERQNIPFPLPLLRLHRSHKEEGGGGGGDLCVPERWGRQGSCFCGRKMSLNRNTRLRVHVQCKRSVLRTIKTEIQLLGFCWTL